MVKVFKTNVRNNRQAKLILQKLGEDFPKHKINFDLFDYDGVLRIQGSPILGRRIISIVTSLNFNCEFLK
jgi:hypothetical protein